MIYYATANGGERLRCLNNGGRDLIPLKGVKDKGYACRMRGRELILKCHHRQMALAFFVCVSSFGWQQLLLFRDDCKILSAAVVPFSLFELPEGQKRGWYQSSQMGWPAHHTVRKHSGLLEEHRQHDRAVGCLGGANGHWRTRQVNEARITSRILLQKWEFRFVAYSERGSSRYR